MRHRELDRRIGVADGVELLVAVLDAVDDLDSIRFVGRRNLDGLEAALKRTIFLNGLAIFARRGCADALDFSTRESRLENVGCVERPLCRSRSDQRMQLVYEYDGVLILHQLFHDGLEPLFKLPAVFCAGHDQGKIETEDFLVGEKAGNFAVGDALRKPFHDRRLADAGLADEHGIVLGAAAENLDDAFQFAIAAHQRIELSVHGFRPGSGRG